MYSILEKRDGTYLCEVRIQDGTERSTELTRQEAVFSVIKSARIFNGTYITEKDICFQKETEEKDCLISRQDKVLLDKIKCKELVVLPHNDPRVAMNITPDECNIIIQIREGDIKI